MVVKIHNELSNTETARTSAVPSRENPLPVAQVNRVLRDRVVSLGSVWVEGEITAIKNNRGNIYGTLRDLEADAMLNFAIWRNVAATIETEFTQGDRVIIKMQPDYWIARGSLTFNVTYIEHAGLGQLLAQLEKLRQKLASEGLFAAARKKSLPFLPQCIGLITGRDSDAEKDVLQNAKLRWPGVQFRVVHAAVQGEKTVSEVTKALIELDNDSSVDVIIIARGGGDFLHLLPFSDESLVRAVAAATTPVVSAIGHEADRPLLDEVADLRASTPTDAAKRVVPDIFEEQLLVQEMRLRCERACARLLDNLQQQLLNLRSRPVLVNPDSLLAVYETETSRWADRAFSIMQLKLAEAETALSTDTSALRALSPLSTLQRGYSVVTFADGKLVRSAANVAAGSKLQINTADGEFAATAN